MTQRLLLPFATLLFALSSCSGGAADASEYPLTTCVVSGNALDSMGGPVDYDHGGKLVRFCCDGCVAAFESSPDEFLAQIYPDDHGHDHGDGTHDHDH